MFHKILPENGLNNTITIFHLSERNLQNISRYVLLRKLEQSKSQVNEYSNFTNSAVDNMVSGL